MEVTLTVVNRWSAVALVSVLSVAGWWSPVGASGQRMSFTTDLAVYPTSLADLCRTSPLIVDASVQSVFPATPINTRGNLATDVVLNVIKTLKGDPVASQIVVAQSGGILQGRQELTWQFPQMEPGQHYVFFLHPYQEPVVSQTPKPASTLPALPKAEPLPRPVRVGIPRFEIYGGFAGALRIEGNRVMASSGHLLELRQSVESKSPNELLSEIATIVALSR